uniref:ATP synthase F0 subunit 8 n=1 Tax=Austromenopon paululum TaxID=2965261 RepID=UPI0026E177B2|nr:ATP synthase F0 subunit 8 [Austromenopon paululum]WJJ69868.1 ATP synthase subunit 8 [Austromenopon paululum]
MPQMFPQTLIVIYLLVFCVFLISAICLYFYDFLSPKGKKILSVNKPSKLEFSPKW